MLAVDAKQAVVNPRLNFLLRPWRRDWVIPRCRAVAPFDGDHRKTAGQNSLEDAASPLSFFPLLLHGEQIREEEGEVGGIGIGG